MWQYGTVQLSRFSTSDTRSVLLMSWHGVVVAVCVSVLVSISMKVELLLALLVLLVTIEAV